MPSDWLYDFCNGSEMRKTYTFQNLYKVIVIVSMTYSLRHGDSFHDLKETWAGWGRVPGWESPRSSLDQLS